MQEGGGGEHDLTLSNEESLGHGLPGRLWARRRSAGPREGLLLDPVAVLIECKRDRVVDVVTHHDVLSPIRCVLPRKSDCVREGDEGAFVREVGRAHSNAPAGPDLVVQDLLLTRVPEPVAF